MSRAGGNQRDIDRARAQARCVFAVWWCPYCGVGCTPHKDKAGRDWRVRLPPGCPLPGPALPWIGAGCCTGCGRRELTLTAHLPHVRLRSFCIAPAFRTVRLFLHFLSVRSACVSLRGLYHRSVSALVLSRGRDCSQTSPHSPCACCCRSLHSSPTFSSFYGRAVSILDPSSGKAS